MNIKSKIILFSLAAMLLQSSVILAADTQTSSNLQVKTAGDGTVKNVATNPALSAPVTPLSTTPGVLTGATKATPVPSGLPSITNPDSQHMCPQHYSCKITGGTLYGATCELGANGVRDCTQAAPRCSDYRDVGSNARPERANGDNYQCPPGYACHWSGAALECRHQSVGEVVFASGPYCHMNFCGNVNNQIDTPPVFSLG